MRKLPFLLSALAAGVMMLPQPEEPEEKQPEQEEVEESGEEEKSVRKYGVYLDEECEIPYTDEEDVPMEMTVDENGEFEHIVSEETLYLRQLETITGYYMDPDVHEMNDVLVLPVYPIEVSLDFDGRKEGTFELYDETEEVMILEWSLEECESPCVDHIGSILEAGHNYILKETQCPQWTVKQEIPFSVSKEPVEEMKITVPVMYYGSLKAQVKGLLGNAEMTYALFDDEKCTQQAKDIHGKDVRISCNDNTVLHADLKEGTYYLKAIKEDTHYLSLPVRKVEVREKQENEIEIVHTPVKPSFVLRNEEGNPLEGMLKIRDEDGVEKTVQSGEAVLLERNREYHVEVSEIPSGYYMPAKLTYKTVYETGVIPDVSVTCESFTVKLTVLDKDTGNTVTGSEFAVFDEAGNYITGVRPSVEGTEIRGLLCNHTYRIHQVRTADTYLPVKDHTLVIPENGESSISIEIQMEGYVSVSGSIRDDAGEDVEHAMIVLYSNPECTKEATDIDGYVISGVGTVSANMRNGTYYARLENLKDTYFEHDEVIPLSVSHASSVETSFQFTVIRTDMIFEVKDQNEEAVNDFRVELYEKTKLIRDNLAVNRSLLEQGVRLRIGKKYSYRLVSTKGQYSYNSRRQYFEMPKNEEEGICVIPETITPYVTLAVLNPEANQGVSYTLYEDIECHRKARDISGSAKTVSLSSGKAAWNVQDGTYYLKETEAAGMWYRNEEVIEINVNHHNDWSQHVIIDQTPVTMTLSCVDENGSAVSGNTVEIINSEGISVDTVAFTGSPVTLQADWLKRGSTYTIHEIQKAEGYRAGTDMQFTVPATQPLSEPVVTIVRNEKQTVNIPGGNRSVKKENETGVIRKPETVEKQSSDTGMMMGIGIGALVLIGSLFILKQVSKKKM